MPTNGDPHQPNGVSASFASPRPHLPSHQSNSVPSTPYSRENKLSNGARSPSPPAGRKTGSPQSIHSAADGSYRSKAPSFNGCKYETGMAYARRRIPYSEGGDQLERAKLIPKKFLNPEQEDKLSGDMRELYDRLFPSQESDQRRATFVQKLGKILNDQWPESHVVVHVFGSSGNWLCTSDSDVDICITTSYKPLERVCLLAKVLADHGMERVVCVPSAKVPIVKFWDPEMRLACDMNVNNTLALENTRMIKTYVEIDERVRPLAMIVKHWTKRRILNDAALGGTLSSYTWICMILNFLQTRNPPILPSLHKRPHMQHGNHDKTKTFIDDPTKFRGYGKENKETIGELLFNFFRRYAHDLDYEKNVISVREGRLISKEAKKWHLMQNNRLCVEEPFNTERNLGNTADDISFRGIHLELRRAFDMISEARIEECMEQYEYPTAEERVWETSTEKANLNLRSRSQSQSSRTGRGAYGTRGGRHNQYRSNNRRNSSATATNRYPIPLTEPAGLRGREFFPRDQQALQAQEQAMLLHQHFMLEMQHLHEQEQRLRILQAQTQQQAQLRETSERSVPHQFSPRELPQRTVAPNQVPLSVPLRSGQVFSPYVYPQVSGTPIQSVHTQPSSPSMKQAQPDLRRTLHRASGAENGSSNPRSHSQPARPMAGALPSNPTPPLPLNSQTYLQYHQSLRQQQSGVYGNQEAGQARLVRPDGPVYSDPNRHPIDFAFEDNVPKEYVGYWVNDSSMYQYRDDQMIPFIPSYQELQHRVRGLPPTIDRLRRASRSPSPSSPAGLRNRSHSVRSASSAPTGPVRYDHIHQHSQTPRTGPTILNGTDGWPSSEYPPPEYAPMVDSSSHTTISEEESVSEDQQDNASATAEVDPSINHSHAEDRIAVNGLQHVSPSRVNPDQHRLTGQGRKTNADVGRRPQSSQQPENPPQASQVRKPSKATRGPGGLGIQFGEVEFPRALLKGKRSDVREPSTQTPSVSKGESDPATPSSAQFEQPSASIPLLSPVREVRTPSPVGKRNEEHQNTSPQTVRRLDPKVDLRIPTFAELLRSRQQKQQNGTIQKPNGVPAPSKLAESAKAYTPSPPPAEKTMFSEPVQKSPSLKTNAPASSTSPRSKAPPVQTNGWQQQSSKKNRKNRSRPGSGQYPTGEALPANASERKGG